MARAVVRVLDVSRIRRRVFVDVRTRMDSLFLDLAAVHRWVLTRHEEMLGGCSVESTLFEHKHEYAQSPMLMLEL